MLGGAIMGEIRHCHDRSIPRVEVRNQSLGQYHRGHRHHSLYLGRHGVISPLHFHRQRRDPLPAADCLVCMEVAQPRRLARQMRQMSNSKTHPYRSKKETKMNTNKETEQKKSLDVRIILAALWVAEMLSTFKRG